MHPTRPRSSACPSIGCGRRKFKVLRPSRGDLPRGWRGGEVLRRVALTSSREGRPLCRRRPTWRWWSVARVRSMRSRQARRSLSGGALVGWLASLARVAVPAACRDERAQLRAEQALRLGAQELRPAGADPPRGRSEPRAAQHGRDRRVRDTDPKPLQFTLDAHVTPAGVLAGQSSDQTAYLGGKRRATGRALARTPVQQRPVPAAQRLCRDRKARPALAWKQAACCGEHGAVGGRVLRPLPAAPEDRELVAQDDDLQLPLTAAAREHAHQATEEPVQQRRQHDTQSEPIQPRTPARPGSPNRISLPHTSRASRRRGLPAARRRSRTRSTARCPSPPRLARRRPRARLRPAAGRAAAQEAVRGAPTAAPPALCPGRRDDRRATRRSPPRSRRSARAACGRRSPAPTLLVACQARSSLPASCSSRTSSPTTSLS